MVAQLLGLKLRLLANAVRRSPSQRLGIAVAVIYSLAATVSITIGFGSLSTVATPLAADIAVVVGTLITLGFLLVPLAFGADDVLDPRAFSLFGIPTGRLAGALILASLVGLPAIAILSVAIGQVSTWRSDPAAGAVAQFGVVLIVAICVLSSRVATSIAALLLFSRRSREVTRLIAFVILICATPLAVVLFSVDWSRDGERILASIAQVAGWTPLGAAWSAPAEAALGHSALVLAKLLIAVGFIAVLWMSWYFLVARMTRSPRGPEPAPRAAGLGWFDRMPHTPTGAVSARIITYWVRDSRYHASLVAIPVAPVIFVAALAVAGVPWHVLALIPIPAMCLFLSWLIHNDVAYDNSAVWLHISSNVRGWSDRFGRVVPALLIGIPLVAVGAPFSAWLFGDFTVLPSIVGVSASALLGGLGISSLISAMYPYPTVRPGDSPFAQPQASGTSAGLIQSVAFFASLLVTVPSVTLAIFGITSGGGWPMISLVVGIGVGVVVFAFGILVGGWLFTRRSPELLAFTLRT